MEGGDGDRRRRIVESDQAILGVWKIKRVVVEEAGDECIALGVVVEASVKCGRGFRPCYYGDLLVECGCGE